MCHYMLNCQLHCISISGILIPFSDNYSWFISIDRKCSIKFCTLNFIFSCLKVGDKSCMDHYGLIVRNSDIVCVYMQIIYVISM